jgi:hypothetical protein
MEDECDMCKETKCQMIEAQAVVRSAPYTKSEALSDRTSNDKLTMELDVPDESCCKGKNARCTEILLESQPISQTFRRINVDGAGTDPARTNAKISGASYNRSGAETEPLRNQDCDSNVIKICSDIHADHAVSHDGEIISCESKQKVCTSKDITRSNSAHSQDINDHTGNVRLKLKAYKVTERCKSNIIGRRTRCRKCCCVVS